MRFLPRTVFYYFMGEGGGEKLHKGVGFHRFSNENSNAARIFHANEIYDEDILDRYCN